MINYRVQRTKDTATLKGIDIMNTYQHDGIWMINIKGGAVLFREYAGHREVVAMGKNLNDLVIQGKSQTEPGGYYIADHGTYCINNAAVTEAMIELFNTK